MLGVRFQVLMVVSMKITALRDIVPCSLRVYRIFQVCMATIITLMMEAVDASKTMVYFDKTTWLYTPEG
jgi:hypothetical protein